MSPSMSPSSLRAREGDRDDDEGGTNICVSLYAVVPPRHRLSEWSECWVEEYPRKKYLRYKSFRYLSGKETAVKVTILHA